MTQQTEFDDCAPWDHFDPPDIDYFYCWDCGYTLDIDEMSDTCEDCNEGCDNE